MCEVRFKVSNEKLFTNGRIILNSLLDIEDKIRTALSQEETVDVKLRNPKGKPEYEGI